MIGNNPLWVAKQHGHSVQTMLDVYAAWTDGSKESDIAAIKHAMESRPLQPPHGAHTTTCIPLASPEFGTDLALAIHRCSTSRGNIRQCNGGERGIRTGFRPQVGSASYGF